VKAAHPGYTVGDIAKELGRRWETCSNKGKYEALAAKDKARYEQVAIHTYVGIVGINVIISTHF